MRKLIYNLFMFCGLFSLLFVYSCTEDPEDPETPLPAADGSVDISFLNYAGAGTVTTTAAAGDVMSIAVEIKKTASGNRPQKLRVWQANKLEVRGVQVVLEGKNINNEGTVDLRNVDEQVRQIIYNVPSGISPIYLYFEVDESADKFARKLMIINVSGSGVIDSYSNITLGAQDNAAPSRMSSMTGYVFKACETAENIDYIDLTYAYNAKAYFSSNPARFLSPIGLTLKERDCGDEGKVRTDGGKAVYFASTSNVDFDAADDKALDALTVSSSNKEYIDVVNGGVYAFLNSQNKKGLIKVKSLTTGVSGTITIDVKVQR